MSQTVTVHKRDAAGREVFRYSGTVLRETDTSLTLEALYDLDDKDLPGLTFRYGDRFIEAHYSDRWYNVYAVFEGESGRLKGWYCNITRPAVIKDGHVSADDLALDLIVQPDGTWLAVDEDEFGELQLPSAERAAAEAAMAELKRHAVSLTGPFELSGEN